MTIESTHITDNTETLNAVIDNARVKLTGLIGIGKYTGKRYTGSYVTIPNNQEQILETKSKTLVDDIHIKAIPFYETANETGTTVYIGGE